MQKFVNKSLSALLVLTLLLSVSIVAFAATVPVTYYCTVTKGNTDHDLTQVSELSVLHNKGTANEIAYSVSSQVYAVDTEEFPPAFRTSLIDAYLIEGFVEVLNVEAKSGSKTVNASLPSGTYMVVLNYCNADADWSVAPAGGAAVEFGTIESAPISYSIDLYRIA